MNIQNWTLVFLGGMATTACAVANGPSASLAQRLPVVSPLPVPAACFVHAATPFPSPLPASGFTFEIASFQDPHFPIGTNVDAMKRADSAGTQQFLRDILLLELTSESYLADILSHYNATVVRQVRPNAGPAEVTPEGATLTPSPVPGACPSYTIKMNSLDTVDLADLPTWAGRAGLSGHLIFFDKAAAALLKLSIQISYENVKTVSLSSMVPLSFPAYRLTNAR
jgi:hypothetical protein